MSNHLGKHWITIEEAAKLTGKSTSTIRRAITDKKAVPFVKRVPIDGAGGQKIVINRGYIESRYQVKELPSTENEATSTPGETVQLERLINNLEKQVFSLSREVETKNRIIDDYSRLASDLTNNVREQVVINATLQNKILTLSEGKKEVQPSPGAKAEAEAVTGGWYWVVVSVCISMIVLLLLYLLLIA